MPFRVGLFRETTRSRFHASTSPRPPRWCAVAPRAVRSQPPSELQSTCAQIDSSTHLALCRMTQRPTASAGLCCSPTSRNLRSTVWSPCFIFPSINVSPRSVGLLIANSTGCRVAGAASWASRCRVGVSGSRRSSNIILATFNSACLSGEKTIFTAKTSSPQRHCWQYRTSSSRYAMARSCGAERGPTFRVTPVGSMLVVIRGRLTNQNRERTNRGKRQV